MTRTERPSQKLTHRIDIPCTEEMYDRLIGLATMMGKPKAEVARDLLTVQLEGTLVLVRSNMPATSFIDDGRN